MFNTKRYNILLILFILVNVVSFQITYAKSPICTVLNDILKRDSVTYYLTKYLDQHIDINSSEVDITRLKKILSGLSYDKKIKFLTDYINKSSTVFNKQSLLKLLKKYPPEKQEDVLKAFHDLTLYSSMDDVNIVAKFLNKKFPNLYIGDPITGKMGAFNYLSNKALGALSNNIFKNNKKMNLNEFLKIPTNSSIMVDQTILEILKKNPQAIAHIKQSNIKLVYLNGLIESIDYSDTANLSNIQQKIDRRLSSNVNFPDFKSTIDVRSELEKLGVSDRFQPIYYDKSRFKKQMSLNPPKRPWRRNDYDYLVSRLGRKYFNVKELKKHMKRIPKQNHEQVLDVVISTGSFKSLQNMALESQQLKLMIEKKVQSLGKDKSDIIYLRPDYLDDVKSMSLMSYLFQSSNQIPESNFISYSEIFRNRDLVAGKVVVILDDFVGSGSSMDSLSNRIRGVLPKGSSVLSATMYGTRQGVERLERVSKISKLIKGVEIDAITLKEIPTYRDSVMSVKELARYPKGYGESDTLFSMEYMSPDNNNLIMSPFAHTFTFESYSVKDWGNLSN